MLSFQTENGSQAIFLNPFIVCSSCKRKIFICPFVYKETNGSYPFANRLNGLAHLFYAVDEIKMKLKSVALILKCLNSAVN